MAEGRLTSGEESLSSKTALLQQNEVLVVLLDGSTFGNRKSPTLLVLVNYARPVSQDVSQYPAGPRLRRLHRFRSSKTNRSALQPNLRQVQHIRCFIRVCISASFDLFLNLDPLTTRYIDLQRSGNGRVFPISIEFMVDAFYSHHRSSAKDQLTEFCDQEDHKTQSWTGARVRTTSSFSKTFITRM